jgi:hypothetical protein
MAITSIQNIANNRNASILFINTESSGNNREIPPNNVMSVGNCWIPWCTRESDFPSHHIEIIDTNTDTVLWYIWQQKAFDGDFIRISPTGFESPDPAHVIGGNSQVGRSYNLWVDTNTVTANDS